MPLESESVPDLIVGVDLGTTYTGVSYLVPKSGDLLEPPVIQRWSDTVDKVFNKVPTVIAVTETGVTWGIQAQSERNDKTLILEHFKLLLDQKMLDYLNNDNPVPITMVRVQGWFRTFLEKLYDWISQELERILQRSLRGAVVEFIFSVPTTWEEETVGNYLEIIKEAGFGRMRGHMVSIGLNEAEAAAVHTAMYNLNHETDGYKQDDIVLVCDAGGGTTDVSILQVTGFLEKIPQFHELCRIDGVAVGSVLIDEAFNNLVKSRLSHLSHLKCNGDHAASGEFQGIKSHLGTDSVDLLTEVTIKIPGLKENIEDAKAQISGGTMKFSQYEIKKLFDDLLPGIHKVIDNLLGLVSDKYPSAQVNYFVLSGGLGSSKYVQQNLKDTYINNPHYPIAKEIKILIAKDPQLVVCRGLVLDRVHHIFNVAPVISQRCCRASYGFVLDELYSKPAHKHLKHERTKSKVDGRYYLPRRIRWFIDRDEPVDYEGSLKVSLSDNVNPKQPDQLHHDIVRFDGELSDRPDKFIEKSCRLVCRLSCSLESTLQEGDTKIVQKQFKHKLLFPGIRWGEFSHITYEISVRVDSAGLRFELCVGGETQCEVKDFEVEWAKGIHMYKAMEQVLDRAGDSQSESDGTRDGLSEIRA